MRVNQQLALVLAVLLPLTMVACNKQSQPNPAVEQEPTSSREAETQNVESRLARAFNWQYLDAQVAYLEKELNVTAKNVYQQTMLQGSEEVAVQVRIYDLDGCALRLVVDEKTSAIQTIGASGLDDQCYVVYDQMDPPIDSRTSTLKSIVAREGVPSSAHAMLNPGNVEEAWYGTIAYEGAHVNNYINREYEFPNSDGMDEWRESILSAPGVEGDEALGDAYLQENMAQHVQTAIEAWGDVAPVAVTISRQ